MMGECCLVTPRSRKSSERPGAPGIYLALRRLTEPRVTIEGVLLTCTSGTVLPSSRFVLSTPSSWPKQGIPMKKRICSPQICGSALLLAVLMVLSSAPAVAQSVPPTSPTGLTATAASCGQVNLSWSAPTDNSGTGLKAYSISRSDGVNTSIGASRTSFSDTNYVRSSTTLTYTVVAQDNAGNKSLPSGAFVVTTPACPMSAGEEVIDTAYIEPLGKSMATYGTRRAVIYQKQNPLNSTWDTWLYVSDSDTGLTSHFLLHTQPAYYQTETDYVLTSATELWTLSCDVSLGGHLFVSQYQLNGSPSSSATLISAMALGDAGSKAKSMIRLQSGALIVAWNEEGWGYTANDLTTGYAYRSPTGNWTTKFPVNVPNSGGGNIVMSQAIMAQHPADNSIWAFIKRDSFTQISALHFTETANDFTLDWINPYYITQAADGDNGPEGEFPFLAAAADSTRNAILLAYQSYHDQSVFTDPLYGSMNSIFLKQANAAIAQVGADGSKTFVPFRAYMERCIQFGMSVLSDGAIWLAYQPINSQTLTWNEVYASKYQDGVWSTPVRAGFNYQSYNVASGERDPGVLIYRVDQPQVAFRTPDQKIHTFDLSNLSVAPADTTAPTTSITSPSGGASVSGSVTISVSASDNVGITKVELLVDGSVAGTMTSSPYVLLWDTTKSPNGTHTLQTKAYDAAGNVGLSTTVSANVNNPISSANLVVAITNPTNGGTVPRNQKVTISAAASDNVAVIKMEFYVNNNLLGTATATPFNYPWKVPGKRGLYNIKAKGYDAMGNSAAQAITVTAQ